LDSGGGHKLIIPGILASSKTGNLWKPSSSDYQSISTATVTSGGTASITFSSIPSTYTHLQLRFMFLPTAGANGCYFRSQLNGDTGSNYAFHSVWGTGAAATIYAYASQSTFLTGPNGGSNSNSIPNVGVIDILDYANVSKNTTGRMLTGGDYNGGGSVDLTSALWINTAAVNSISILAYSQGAASNFGQYSSFALYGIR
jgi:hypothetical protein